MSGDLERRGSGYKLVAYAGRDPLSGRKRYVSRRFSVTNAKRSLSSTVASSK
jgi:hypothetical protein